MTERASLQAEVDRRHSQLLQWQDEGKEPHLSTIENFRSAYLGEIGPFLWNPLKPLWVRAVKLGVATAKEYLGEPADPLAALALLEDLKRRLGSEARMRFGADFHQLRWGNEEFTFSDKQAAVCRALWEARQNGTPGLAILTLLQAAGSSMADTRKPRLRDLFKERREGKRGFHPAWNRVIVPAGDRLYKLADPPD